MRIVISHAYSTDNKGDAALLDVLISDIRRKYGKSCHIDILTIDNKNEGNKFSGVNLHPAFMFHAFNAYSSKPLKLIYSLWMMVYTLLWARLYGLMGINLPLPKKWKQIADMYRSADMIIAVGGGYFRTSAGIISFVSLLLMLHPLMFAKYLSKPTFLYTMSVGPFSRKIEERITAHVFRKVPLILVREDTSLKLLKNIGVSDNIVRSVDSGFSFSAKHNVHLKRQLGLKKDDVIVGVTARKWLEENGQETYERELAGALDMIISRKSLHVVFIPQVTSVSNNDDDRVVSRSIAAKMKAKNEVHLMEDDYDLYAVKAMYDELDFIIGTRFHSVIFSLTSYVPAIAIEYEHKTSGIMKDLELTAWTLKIEDVTSSNIYKKFDKLYSSRSAYVKHLKARLPTYKKRAKAAIELVDSSYKNIRQ